MEGRRLSRGMLWGSRLQLLRYKHSSRDIVGNRGMGLYSRWEKEWGGEGKMNGEGGGGREGQKL